METRHRFRSFDGTPLEGTLARGAASRRDVVLMVHGITSSRNELGLFSGLARHLEQAGRSSFRFDYRCHGVNKGPTKALTLSGVVNDIEAAAACAVAETKATSIHVVGMSFGGGLSAFWGATTEHSVSSVVMLAPVIDYVEDTLGQYDLLSKGRLKPGSARTLQKQGTLKAGGIRYGPALINELRYISGVEGLLRLRCDSRIIHGDADSIVPFASSERFVKLNARCRLVNIPGTDHGFGVGDDEDLSSPATKAKHREVFDIISQFLDKGAGV